MEVKKYVIEQINVSDDEYTITSIEVKNSQLVNEGDILFSYESSKTNFEVNAELNGYIYLNDSFKVDDLVVVGDIIAFSSLDKLDDNFEFKNIFNHSSKAKKSKNLNNEFIITKKAKILIDQHNINVDEIDFDNNLLTEKDVRSYVLSLKKSHSFQDLDYYFQDLNNINFNINLSKKNNSKKIAIIGAGKSFLQIFHIINDNNLIVSALYDDNETLIGKKIVGIEIKDRIDYDIILNDYENNIFDEIIISFSGNITKRKEIFDNLIKLEIPITNLIDKSVLVSPHINIGVGNIIFGNVVLSSFSKIGNNNFISAFCNIEHHNSIGSHNTFGPGVMFSGSCSVMDECKFGTGVFIEPRVKINSKCIVASGSIVQKNLKEKTLLRTILNQDLKKI